MNLNLFLFYNGYKLGRMPLFIERERERGGKFGRIQNGNCDTPDESIINQVIKSGRYMQFE